MRNNTSNITLAAALIALLGVLQVVNNLLGQVFTNFAPFVYPLVFIVYSSRNSLSWSITMYVASIFTIFMLSSLPQLIFIAMYGIVGVFFGQAYQKKKCNYQLIIGSTFLLLFINILTVFVFGSFFGLDLQSELVSLINILPFLTLDSALVVYYVIILSGAYLEAVVIYMIDLILFAYLRMKPIIRVHWWQYPQSVKEKLSIFIIMLVFFLLYYLFSSIEYLLLAIVALIYLGFLITAAMVYQSR